MLSDIATLWPPQPGPNQTQTGTKTKHPVRNSAVSESLTDLHKPAWWTGVRVNVPDTGHDVYAYVSLVKADGSPVFATGCEWVQPTRVWYQFPWAIPAAMGKALGIRVDVRLMDNEEHYIGLTTCFHEMPLLPPNDRYLFISAAGTVIQQWNGLQDVYGTPAHGDAPVWRTIHRLVPPSELLDTWDDNKMFCIHDWSEVVPM